MPASTLSPAIAVTRFHPVLGTAPDLQLSNSLLRKTKNIDFSSRAKTLQTLKAQQFNKKSMGGVIQHVFSNSEKQGESLIKAYVDTWEADGEDLEASTIVMNVARVSKVKQRRGILRSLIASKKSAYVVHNIGGMSPTDAKSVMLDYFEAGGSADEVANWLADASRYLDENDNTTEGTDGIFDAIGGAINSAIDWTKGAIKTVGNALSAAAKKLGEAIEAVAGWTLSKVKDFVKGLIRAGRTVAAILAEAIKHGQTAINKFVNGLLAAGKTIASLATWAVEKTSTTLRNIMTAIMDAGKTVGYIFRDVARFAAEKLRSIVSALLRLGSTLSELLSAVVSLTLSGVKNVLNALIALRHRVSTIIAEAANAVSMVLKKVMEGLLSLGRTLSELVAAAARLTIAATRKVVAELLDLGRTVAQLMTAALAQSATALRKIVNALVTAAASVAEVLSSVASAVKTVVRATIRGIIDAGVSVVNLARQLSEFAGTKLSMFVATLFEVSRKLSDIIKGFVANTLSAARTLIEALLSAGAHYVKTVVAILKNVAQGNYKTYFEALNAMGKGLLEVAVQSLKLGGSIAVAAFSAVLEVFGGHRPLTASERKEATKIFGSSLDLSRVKIAVASIPADIILEYNGGRPFVTMYVINFSSGDKINTQTLMHELTHVWQAKHSGPIYAVDALHAQMTLGADAYKVEDQDLIDADGDFSKFNPEQQATIVDRYWAAKFGGGRRTEVNPIELLEPYAKQVYKPLRSRTRPNLTVPGRRPVLRPGRIGTTIT